MLSQIPFELQQLNQWVIAGTKKEPHNPNNGELAKVNDSSTWGTFERAIECGWPHVGLVLTESDPYCIIDLDSPYRRDDKTLIAPSDPDFASVAPILVRHKRILDTFETYAEFSQSGEGVHIVCKAKTSKGARRAKIEVYSTLRYMIFTGKVLKAMPIANCQELVDELLDEMSVTMPEVPLVQVEGSLSDNQLYQLASTAGNAAKFNLLWAGSWQGQPQFPSHSEADFALMSMLAFYSPDNDQCRRMFRYSGLDRPKATDKYLNRMLRKMRAKELPPIDLTKLKNIPSNESPKESRSQDSVQSRSADLSRSVESKDQLPIRANGELAPQDNFAPMAAATTDRNVFYQTESQAIQEAKDRTDGLSTDETPASSSVQSRLSVQLDSRTGGNQTTREANGVSIAFPKGFIGELANYIYATSIRPVREISLATSLALLAGIAGRCYNISRTGLNQYIILLAKTGSGKEECGKAIDNLIASIRSNFPTADDFIGPSSFASGQAMIRVLDRQPCFVSILGEFPFLLQTISDPRANNAQQMLKKVLLDLYSKSGKNQILRSSAYSDTDKNTKAVVSPSMTILGEGTPEKFYDELDASDIAQGLIPRFLIFEYTGPRPDTNDNAGQPPPPELVQKLAFIVSTALAAGQNRAHCDVMIDGDAKKIFVEFDKFATYQINLGGSNIVNELWNRAHLKALKLAGLVAVGCNPSAPVVDSECAAWAISLVEGDVNNMLRKFAAGDVGTGDMRKEADMRRAIDDWLKMGVRARREYEVPEKVLNTEVIPMCFFRRRLRTLVSYRKDRLGSQVALNSTIKAMLEAGEIQQLSPAQSVGHFETNMPLFVRVINGKPQL